MTDYKNLILAALSCRKNAYAPYSGFKVGAALMCENGNLYTGCNLENASYSATICAERVAFAEALKNGESRFSAIAIVGGKEENVTDFCPPCGVCRQFMAEFCDKDFKIILFNGTETKTYKFSELLPNGFSGEYI